MNTPRTGIPLLACATLIVAGLAAFWPSTGFDFVNWDDPAYVWHNDLIKSWSPSSLVGVATETVTRNYAPLTILTLLIDHTIWGMNPAGFHATNVILHLLNGILVFLLVRQLTGISFVAWLTAALFLVHPVQIETVAWISSRKGLLSATFMLSALLVRLKPEVTSRDEGKYLLWIAAALLSKALAVVVPAIVLTYDVIVRRERFSDAFVRQVIPGLMAVMLLLKTMGAQNTILGGLRGHFDLSLLQIVAVDVTILWKYLSMLAWPSGLSVLYDPPTSGIAVRVALGSAGLLAIAAAAWLLRNSRPMGLWAIATFSFLLLPVMNLFRITTLMNDRYLYLPCIVVFAAAALALHRLLHSTVKTGTALQTWVGGSIKWATAAALVCGALCATANHLPVWRNSDSLWKHAMTQVPHLPVVRIQTALTQYDSGRKREAVRTMQTALLECQPDDLDRKRMRKAIEEWSTELSFRSNHTASR